MYLFGASRILWSDSTRSRWPVRGRLDDATSDVLATVASSSWFAAILSTDIVQGKRGAASMSSLRQRGSRPTQNGSPNHGQVNPHRDWRSARYYVERKREVVRAASQLI